MMEILLTILVWILVIGSIMLAVRVKRITDRAKRESDDFNKRGTKPKILKPTSPTERSKDR